jgi:hypothetical protein
MTFESKTGIATHLSSEQIRVIEVTCVSMRKLCRSVKGEDGYLSSVPWLISYIIFTKWEQVLVFLSV